MQFMFRELVDLVHGDSVLLSIRFVDNKLRSLKPSCLYYYSAEELVVYIDYSAEELVVALL
jgi:hypothetical protein